MCEKGKSEKKCKKMCKKKKKTMMYYKGTTHPSGCKDVCECE